ncbi:MAG: TROVE domain-containing protein [Saprospiraceae bacterium]|nr:TROVE domain-containing protein [Saprospiraceae bacterium]
MFFNKKVKSPTKTINHAGASAYKMTPAQELYAAVVTATLSDKFYETGNKRLLRLRALVAQNDPIFVAKLAIYARERMHLRSVPLVLAIELAKIHRGDDLLSRLIGRVIQRADEITEMLAFYAQANERDGVKQLNRLSKQVQKGLVKAFNKFDAFQFAKYDREGAAVKLRDALFLTHPVAKDAAQQAIFNQIATGTLETPYTWETELSVLGQQKFANEAEKKAAFRAKWQELIDSGKLGYMAMMRNLRNMLEAQISGAHVNKVCKQLADPKQVAQSKQLPFRFLAAYRELLQLENPKTAAVLQALEDAVMASTVNLRGFDMDTTVVVACDVSGSMQKSISAKSKVLNYDIGLMLGMLLKSKCRNVIAGMFGDTWKVIQLPGRNVLSNVQEFYRREGEVGYSTNGYLVIADLLKRQVPVDKVMLFTDCQLWNSQGTNETLMGLWMDYRKKIAPDAKLYLFDLAGLGNTPFDLRQDQGVALIAGWSDKVFEVLDALENGETAVALIDAIELY